MSPLWRNRWRVSTDLLWQLEVHLQWNYGGEEVYVIGSFTNWDLMIKLNQKEPELFEISMVILHSLTLQVHERGSLLLQLCRRWQETIRSRPALDHQGGQEHSQFHWDNQRYDLARRRHELDFDQSQDPGRVHDVTGKSARSRLRRYEFDKGLRRPVFSVRQ